MATELLEPGVSVIQEFRSVSPTIVTPTLVPCAVAPCFQVIEALETDATGNSVLNTDAVASVPGILTAQSPGPYAGLDGLVLKVRINNGPTQEFTFSDPLSAGLSAAQVKDQIAAASPDGFGAFVQTISSSTYLQLRTTSAGDGQIIEVLDGDANAVLGFDDNFASEGVSKYKQTDVNIAQGNFPDPNGIIDEIDIDEDSIRVFINTGSALRELLRTETFLRRKKEAVYTSAAITFPTTTLTGKKFAFVDVRGESTEEFTFAGEAADVSALVTAMNTLIGKTVVFANGTDKIDFVSYDGYVEVVAPSSDSAHAIIGWTDGDKAYTVEALDDGDGDTRTPFILVDRDNFSLPAGSAQLVGSATLTGAQAVHNLEFEVALDGGQQQSITFDGGPIVGTSVFDGATNTLDTEDLAIEVNGTLITVTFSGTDPIAIADVIAQINAAAGTTVCYESDSAGVETPAGGYLAFQVGGSTPVSGAEIKLIYASSTPAAWTDLGLPGTADIEQTLTIAEIITQINNTMGAGFSSNDGSDKLQLDSSITGAESKIGIGAGTANSVLGFTDDSSTTGRAFPPKVGDAVYGDGTFIGNIAEVTPGAVVTKLKLDREVSTSYWAVAMYIQSKNIPTTLPADRPTPDLVVNLAGDVLIKQDILRDTEGAPIDGAEGELVLAFNALRLDVTVKASEPGLLTFDDPTTLESALPPINTDNPLALMVNFMLLNAPGIEVTGLGVDAVTADSPEGTVEAYSRALAYLKGQEVYALAPGSQDPTVHQVFATHVDDASEPDNKGERIVFICPEQPGEGIPTIAASGTDGDSTATTNEFDTKLASLSADLLAAGIDPVGTIPVSDGVFLDIASDAKRYNVASITGSKVTLRVAFSPGENDDGFYSESNLPSTLISETFSISIRGADLITTEGDPDYSGKAQAYQDLGNTYGNRRVVMVAPEQVAANIGGLEQKIPGYYLCAAIAGMVGQQPPQQPFSNFPITGFTKVYGSNDVFNRSQMNVGAAGGTYWVVQEVAGAPLTCRHQLTTDLTSIEKRELSITKVVDFVAKFMRSGLRNFIGKFNITQPFLDTLSTVIQGQLSFLTESGVLIGGDLNNIVQDESAPDTVLIDVTLDVPYPCNYIRLTLVI